MNLRTRYSLSHRRTWHPIAILILCLLFCAGCMTPEVVPTPTPTRTPVVPTATPTLTPTPTPTLTPTPIPSPTPTVPPDLVLPATPQTVTAWAPLPSDLYFIRNGRINIWQTEGAHVEIPLLTEDQQTSIHSFQVTKDGRTIAYLTSTGKLYKLDRATWEHTFLPTSGYLLEVDNALYEMTGDGNQLYYIAWGTQPSTASSPPLFSASGTVLGLNLQNPNALQNVVGFCRGTEMVPCKSLALSPDESRLAYIDSQGVWLKVIDQGEAQLIVPQTPDIPFTALAWSPNARWLVVQTGSPEIVLLDTLNTNVQPQFVRLCDFDCQTETSWAADSLWFIIREAAQACLVEVNPATAADNQVEIVNRVCQYQNWSLVPTMLQAFPDRSISFLQQGCSGTCDGPVTALYRLDSSLAMHPVAMGLDADGTVTWNEDSSAFLYSSHEGGTRYIGILNPPNYWNVTSLLSHGTHFQWGATASMNQ